VYSHQIIYSYHESLASSSQYYCHLIIIISLLSSSHYYRHLTITTTTSPPPSLPPPPQSPSHPRLSPEARDLLAGMLRVDPRARLSLEAVLAHPWLSGAASDEHLGDDYTHRVKALAIRRKLKSIFVPIVARDSEEAPPPPAIRTSGLDDDDNGDSSDDGPETLADVDAEARHYFDLMLAAEGGGEGGVGVLTREGLRVGMAKLLSDSCCPSRPWHPSSPSVGLCHAGHCAGEGHSGGQAVLRLTPGVGVNVDEMFDVMDVGEEHTIDFDRFRNFYVIATRGHT
jgi:serine/threonine protein kinase